MYEQALTVAGYLGQIPLAADIAQSIVAIAGELPSQDAMRLASEIGGSLRSMRRFGLHDTAARLIEAVDAHIQGDSVAAMEARIHLAAGLAHLGHMEQARPIVTGAQIALAQMNINVLDRIRLVRALADAWAQLPEDVAVAGLDDLAGELPRITDQQMTNTHFCLSVLAFMEALTIGYARSDLALGELGRHWLEEDEFLIRRRISRELGDLS
jgi:hypothetical protein